VTATSEIVGSIPGGLVFLGQSQPAPMCPHQFAEQSPSPERSSRPPCSRAIAGWWKPRLPSKCPANARLVPWPTPAMSTKVRDMERRHCRCDHWAQVVGARGTRRAPVAKYRKSQPGQCPAASSHCSDSALS
jgi:hypothetical protein